MMQAEQVELEVAKGIAHAYEELEKGMDAHGLVIGRENEELS